MLSQVEHVLTQHCFYFKLLSFFVSSFFVALFDASIIGKYHAASISKKKSFSIYLEASVAISMMKPKGKSLILHCIFACS